VTTRLVTLGHQDVGTQVQGEASRFGRLDLAQNLRAGSLGFLHVGRRIPEREREDGDALLEARAEVFDLLRDPRCDETDPERLAAPFAHEADLLADPCRAGAVDAAEEPEPPGPIDRRGETATGGPSAEWRQHDGASTTKHLSEPCLQHRQPLPPVGMIGESIADMKRVVRGRSL